MKQNLLTKIGVALGFALISALALPALAGSVVDVREVAVEINGVKFWFPSTIIAKKGDTVVIHAVSKIPGKNNVHGFAIKAFGVEEVVMGEEKEIKFEANKAGVFPINCHLHPPHVGGQLLVVE